MRPGSTSGARVEWVKGHGTENDFVLVPDLDARRYGDSLDPEFVRRLCHRRRGIGGDGVMRVVRTAALPAGRPYAGEAAWFMDYRNADGSLAEMCGNGVRVFARYLAEEGLVDGTRSVPVATRGGVRSVRREPDGRYTADMGRALPLHAEAQVRVAVGERTWGAVGLLLPNPHAVAFVDDLAQAGDLRMAPVVTPPNAFPDGVNVEFVGRRGPAHVAMRVYERGSGETRSCGTGACAAAVAAMRADGAPPGTPYVVDVPGGCLEVVERADGQVELTGPAVLVASGEALL